MTSDTTHQLEIIRELDPFIEEQQRLHESRMGNPWMPSEMIPNDYQSGDILPEDVAMLVLNLLTEEGLPHYVALIAKHIGQDGAFAKWTLRWTAEEDRHGVVLHDAMRAFLSGEQMVAVERLQFQFQSGGFKPKWTSPFQLLAYVVLQEMATQVSHHNLFKRVRERDEKLGYVLRQIGAEEARHHAFYFKLYKKLVEIDPSAAIIAFAWMFKEFSMPGAKVPGFKEFSEIQERTGVFGGSELARITTDIVGRLGFTSATGLNPKAEEALEGLDDRIEKIGNIGRRRREKQRPKRIELPFMGPDTAVMV